MPKVTVIKAKVHVVRNWIDTEKTVPVEREKNTLFDVFGLNRDKFYVVYAGTITADRR